MGAKKSVYLSDAIQRVIGDMGPGELSGRIADIVDRYGVLYQQEAPALEDIFTEPELKALCEATWSTTWQPAASIIGGIRADFEDSGPDGLYDKWSVDPRAVVEKLRRLNTGQQIALAEYLEKLRARLCGESENSKSPDAPR